VPTDAKLTLRIHDAMPQVRADLERLVSIPSVSATDWPKEPLVRSAEAVAEMLRAVGADVKILRSNGHPAVVGYVPAPPGAPTVLLYAHHDVQPPGPETDWGSPAFTATMREGRLFGRGSSDDKAGVVAHIAALRAFEGKPPVGVAVFIEGEEEAGSENLRPYLEQERQRLIKAAGKHTIRVKFIAQPADGKGKPIEVITAPLIIELDAQGISTTQPAQ